MSNEVPSRETLLGMRCVPCEGDVPRLSADQAVEQLRVLEGWELSADATKISKTWVIKDFMEAIHFFEKIAELAERENHHPDLHLEGYRRVTVVLSTHAIDGLSENDLILAAKIDDLPVKLKG